MNLEKKPSDEPALNVEFEAASEEAPESFMVEFWGFLRDSKKWWLTPIAIVLGALTLLVVLASSPAAPFIYSLF